MWVSWNTCERNPLCLSKLLESQFAPKALGRPIDPILLIMPQNSHLLGPWLSSGNCPQQSASSSSFLPCPSTLNHSLSYEISASVLFLDLTCCPFYPLPPYCSHQWCELPSLLCPPYLHSTPSPLPKVTPINSLGAAPGLFSISDLLHQHVAFDMAAPSLLLKHCPSLVLPHCMTGGSFSSSLVCPISCHIVGDGLPHAPLCIHITTWVIKDYAACTVQCASPLVKNKLFALPWVLLWTGGCRTALGTWVLVQMELPELGKTVTHFFSVLPI